MKLPQDTNIMIWIIRRLKNMTKEETKKEEKKLKRNKHPDNKKE